MAPAYGFITNDVIEIRITYVQDSQTLMNILHYKMTSASPVTDGPAALTDVLGILDDTGGLFQTIMTTATVAMELTTAAAQKVSPTRWIPVTSAPARHGSKSSAISDVPLPTSNAVTIGRQVAQATKGGKSHIEVPGLVTSSIAAGRVRSDAMAGYQAIADAMKSDLVSTFGGYTFSPCVWRKNVTGSAAKLVVSGSVNPVVHVLQRRVVGRGI